MPYWTWQPSNCELDKVDADNFCRVMAGRKGLLFVGEGCFFAKKPLFGLCYIMLGIFPCKTTANEDGNSEKL